MYVENPTSWGAKRICQDCAAKYYDLRRSPAVCPKCHAEFVEPSKPKSPARDAGGTAARGRARGTPSGHGPSPWGRRSGAHSPFAETRPPENEAGKVPDDGGIEADGNAVEASEPETAEDGADGQ
jgi:hypothetical protein